jgi:hypothetical protein
VIVDEEREPFDRAARTEPRDYRAQIDTLLEVDSAAGPIPLRLVRILAEVRDRSVEWRIEQCSALFRGDAAAALSDGTYAFHHPALGRFQLFVVALGPGGMHAPHVYYEACISRFRSFEERHGD